MFRSLRISHVEFRFPGSEKLGPSRNGRMEWNFPVIPIFQNLRPTSRDTPKISERNSGKCLFHSLHNPEFPEFLVKWKAPYLFREANSFPRVKLEENCELQGTDNVQGQISEHIFAAKLRLLCLLSISFKNWGICLDIPQF